MLHTRLGPDSVRFHSRRSYSVPSRRQFRTATESALDAVFCWCTRTWCEEYWGTELVAPETGYCTFSRSAVRDDNGE